MELQKLTEEPNGLIFPSEKINLKQALASGEVEIGQQGLHLKNTLHNGLTLGVKTLTEACGTCWEFIPLLNK